MKKFEISSTSDVQEVFNQYPEFIRDKMDRLRDLILETARETADIDKVEESLRWGEPSYITKIGSTIRIDWKPKTPNQYAVYFKCTSKLVPSFKEVFGSLFKYEGTRAIIFDKNESTRPELKKCIVAALTYHKVKHLPTLGLERR